MFDVLVTSSGNSLNGLVETVAMATENKKYCGQRSLQQGALSNGSYALSFQIKILKIQFPFPHVQFKIHKWT